VIALRFADDNDFARASLLRPATEVPKLDGSWVLVSP